MENKEPHMYHSIMALVNSKGYYGKKLEKKENQDENHWKFAKLELRSQVLTCSTFTQSQLVMTCSIILIVLPRAGANSKLHQ